MNTRPAVRNLLGSLVLVVVATAIFFATSSKYDFYVRVGRRNPLSQLGDFVMIETLDGHDGKYGHAYVMDQKHGICYFQSVDPAAFTAVPCEKVLPQAAASTTPSAR